MPTRLRFDPYLVLLLLFSVFAIGPLLAPGYFWGAHDGRHSVYFLFEFDRSIQDGIFYPRWAPDFTFGYGYPMFNIYAPGALYLSEAFHLAGFDFVTATKIVFALAILLSGPAMFGFVKRLTGSSQAAFLSGLVYVYAPYHISDIYVRAALEESVALVFLPLCLWGFYETVVNPKRSTIVGAALAFAALAFTHNGIAVLFTVILASWVIFLALRELLRFRLRLTEGTFLAMLIRLGLPSLFAIALGIGMASIFLIPALFEYQFVRTDQWFGNYYNYSNHFLYFFQLFDPNWGFGISVAGPKDGMSFQLGAMPVLMALFSLIAIVRNPNGTRPVWVFFLALALSAVALTLGGSSSVWNRVPLLAFKQFPWRLEAEGLVALATLAGAVTLLQPASGQDHRLSFPTVILGILVLLGSYPYLTAQMQLEPKEGPVSVVGLFKFQQSAGEMTGSTAWVKEIPTWSDVADVYFANKKVKTRAVTTDYSQDVLWIGTLPNGVRTNSERFIFHAMEDNLWITFNLFYYPGWRAFLVKPETTEVLHELPVEPSIEDGRIRVQVPKGREQWLMLRFEDTLPRTIGGWVSAGSILLSIGLLLSKARANWKTNAAPAH